jgi:hypothetical protein
MSGDLSAVSFAETECNAFDGVAARLALLAKNNL